MMIMRTRHFSLFLVVRLAEAFTTRTTTTTSVTVGRHLTTTTTTPASMTLSMAYMEGDEGENGEGVLNKYSR